MRGKMLLVSAVVALVAFSGIILAMTSEEISKLPLKERMKYEQEMNRTAKYEVETDRTALNERERRVARAEWLGYREPVPKDANWLTYADWTNPFYLTWDGPERATLFNPADFGATYPLTLDTVQAQFYLHSDYPWPDSTFQIKIYGDDGTTVLYTSPDIEALPSPEIITHPLTTPVDITSGNFYVAIAPTDASGHPSTLTDNVPQGHSFAGSAGDWTEWGWGEFFISVFGEWTIIDHDVGVTAIYAPTGTYTPGVSVTPSVEVENFGGNNETFDVTFKIFDGVKDEVYSGTQNVTVNQGATQTVDFTPYTTALGSYTTLAYTELGTDEEPLNDTLSGAFSVSEVVPEDTIHFDGPYNNNAIGLTSGGTYEAGIRVTPDELAGYDGWQITSAIFYHHEEGTHSGNVKIYEGGTATSPGALITQEPYSVTGSGWKRIDLTTPVLLDVTSDVWVSVEVTHAAGEYPIGIDAGPAVQGKGDWIYFSGGWQELWPLGLDYNWNVRAIVEMGVQYDHDVAALSIIEPSGTYTSGTVVAPRTRIKNNGTNEETFDTYFKIYDGTKAEVYSEVINTTLSPGVQDTLVFPNFTVNEGSFTAVSYTDLTGDENPANDTATSTFGAISFVEDFESGEWPPEGWETYKTDDQGSPGWRSLYVGAPDGPQYPPYEGDYGAWHNDDSYDCEDWLVSPPLIVGSGASLSFYHNEYYYSWYVYHGVWVSTGSADPADGDFVEVEEVPPIPSPYGWELYGPVDLSAYEGQTIYLAFKYVGNWADEWYLDYITGTALSAWRPDHDVGVTEIIKPEATQVVGDSIYPEVEVKNFGLNPEVFDVTLEIYGATKQEYTSTVTGVSVDPGMTQTVDFLDVWAPTTDGAYDVIAYTLLGTDEVPSNDTSETSVMVVGWAEDFEVTDGGFIPDATGVWEWGAPTSGPGGAHSGENLWATVLDDDYPSNANSTLDAPDFIATSDSPVITFWHWYDIESGFDGGNVKLSTDGGASWTVISPSRGYDRTANSYNPLYPDSIFSGHGQGYWELVDFDLSPYVSEGTVFKIRWHFGSDGSVQYPGWYIDDVAGVGFIPFIPSHDVGISEIISPTGVIMDEDVVTPCVVVENLGPVPDTVDVTFDINPPVLKSRQVYHEVVTAVVDAETTLAVTFPEWTAIAGTYDVTAYTTLATDEDPANDTMTTSLIVATWVEDFEEGSWPPLAWTDYQLGSPSNGWQQFYSGADGSHGDPMGDWGAWHDDDNVDESCDDWLVTTAYQVGPEAQLYFYQRGYYTSYYEYHGLYASTGSGNPADGEFNEVEEVPTVSDWTMYGPVDLSSYEGEQIYLSFVYQGDWADEWYLDSIIGINLLPMVPYDVAVVGIPNGEVGDTIPQGSLLHPSCVVVNNSPVVSGLELSFRVHYKIQKDGNLYWHRVYDVMNLPASAEETVYFPGDVILNEPGDYTVTATIQTGFVDPILWNNTSVRYIHVTSGKGGAQELPRVFALHQNTPNPARANTSICYAIPRTSDVSIRIFDVSGRVVRTLVEATKEPGYYTENWDMRDNRGREIASGVYFYELNAGDFKSIKKMVVMR